MAPSTIMPATLTLLILAVLLPTSSSASALTTLHTFCQESGDGCEARAGLAMGPNGNLYGTTVQGGTNGIGAVFELKQTKRSYAYREIGSFCGSGRPGANCIEGAGPLAGLILDENGNLYGTASGGGTSNAGTAFELSRRKGWKMQRLWAFEGEGFPQASLAYAGQSAGRLYDGHSPLYGTTNFGGSNGRGTVFELVPKGTGEWREQVLYSFCSQGGADCTDGEGPETALVVDAAGNLYGTTNEGGSGNDHGVIFELSPGGKSGWTEVVLHYFCVRCSTDGYNPGGLAFDADGNLIGTTGNGGTQNQGTVFKLTPNGTKSSETTLYNFCSLANCADGSNPGSAVTIDATGNIFGTASGGGANGAGVIYELRGAALTVLYNFCSMSECSDGYSPLATPIIDKTGFLLGTTSGVSKYGQVSTVFEFSP